MPVQNIIVDKTSNRASLKALLSGQTKLIAINFEGGGRGLLDLDHPLANSWARTISYLQENNRPVFVETEDDVITNVYTPEAARVWEISDRGEGEVEVSFYTSSALYHLRRDHPAFNTLLDALKAAKDKDAEVLVTATFYHFEIIDVRPLPAAFGKEAEQAAPVIIAPVRPVTPQRALELFKMMEADTCTPCASSETECIPFKYPPNGCWVRAHLMCYMMIQQGETPAKIWSSGKLQARSSNVPGCRVAWAWHVAATLMVRYEDGSEVNMVFDPSLCDEPVTAEQWKALQTDPNAKLNNSVWTQYSFYGGTADWEKANNDMEGFRIDLDHLCKEYGPSPYNCPL